MFNMLNFSPVDIQFWSGFLDKYRQLKCLWSKSKLDTDKDQYRIERQSAYLELLQYCRIKYPKADINFVTQKLQNFSALFNKSYKKVIRCREQGVTFNPNLWYYKKMLFLIEDELSSRNEKSDKETNILPVIITRIPKRSANDAFQSDSSVQSTVSPLNVTEIKIEKIDENIGTDDFDDCCDSSENSLNLTIINAANSNDYIIENVGNVHEYTTDINILNGIDGSNTVDDINLMNQNSNTKCTEETIRKTVEKSIKRKGKKSKIDYLTRTTLKEIQKITKEEDEFDAAGKKLAFDLREMSKEQKILTEKILSDVIYNGKCNQLKSTYIFKPNNDSTMITTDLDQYS